MSFSDLVSKQIKEAAKSKAQRRLMGWAKACDAGETDCPDRVKDVAKSFKDKAELKKFAKTKEKGLPEKVEEAYGMRKKHDDDYGDWLHDMRKDKELDRRWEEEQAEKNKEPEAPLDEGPAYGAEKWDDYEGDTDTEEEMVAWTGGSGPPAYKDMDIRAKKLVRQAYAQQVGEFASGWGEEPDDDTKQIFWNRAMHDAWATTRQTSESVTLADLDLEESELATAPASPGPDKDGKPHFEKQPADAGTPEWHEPKADWDTVQHKSSLRGVIDAGTKDDMKNKAYTNGATNKPKVKTISYDESIRINHPTKGNGTVVKLSEGYVVIEWDSLNLRPMGPETLTKAEARYVTVIEGYESDPEGAEMGPKAKKKKKKKVKKDEVEEGDVVKMGGEAKSSDLLDPQMITVLKNSYGMLNTIDPESQSYWGLTKLLDGASDALLKQLAGADIKFVSMLAKNRLLKRRVTEDQYEQQPSFQVAPPPEMTIFQDQEPDEDWSADPLATQRGADAAGDGDGPEGDMDEPDDAPDDLNIDHQDLPDSGRAEQIAGEVFKAFDGEGGDRNEIDYKSDQVDFANQSDNSHNKTDSSKPEGSEESDDSGDSESKQAFPARDKSKDKESDSEEKDTERDDSDDESKDESKDEDEDKKEKAEESLSISDFDIEGILD